MKRDTIRKASSSSLWQMIALGVAELAQRSDDQSASPRVEIRRINGGQPQAVISVALESGRRGVPPLLVVGNATLSKKRQHHYEAFPIDAATVARVNRAANRESSSGVL